MTPPSFTIIRQFLAAEINELPPLLVLLGPTAGGKTALSLEIAKRFNAEIISADSRQVYRHMDIGTDKIPPEKREGIPHYLIDVAEPTERFTAANFKRMAEEKIDDILSRGKLPFVVGGTGLYLRALTENFALPPEDPIIRGKLLEELHAKGSEALHARLAEVDPQSATRIHPTNTPYIVRALEIFLTTGRPKNDRKQPPRFRVLKIGLQPSREVLFERINGRVEAQIERGLIEETKSLLARGYSSELYALKTLGYEEMIEHLAGRLTLVQAIELIKQRTRQFAKRQITWWKREQDIVWM